MTTKTINTKQTRSACDVCHRTLLRGERPVEYSDGSRMHQVCELCVRWANQNGWLRSGAMQFREDASTRRRKSLFSRLRGRRGKREEDEYQSVVPPPELNPHVDELSVSAIQAEATPVDSGFDEQELGLLDTPEVSQIHAADESQTPSEQDDFEQALSLFNQSEFVGTNSAIMRSLGTPRVLISFQAGILDVALAWEICWYHYRIDTAAGSISEQGRGYDSRQLAEEMTADQVEVDEHGQLRPCHLVG